MKKQFILWRTTANAGYKVCHGENCGVALSKVLWWITKGNHYYCKRCYNKIKDSR